MATETLTRDNLIAGDQKIVTSSETLDTGDLARGTVLGKISVGAVPTTGTADAGNTGNGTVTVVTGAKFTKVGVYTIKCVEAITNGGRFQVINPDGKLIADVTILAGAGGVIAFTSDELNATITDGSTDFALDDFFTVTIAAGSGKVVIVLSTAIDGSQNPYGVLLKAENATAADKSVPVGLTGQYNEDSLVYGGSDTNATHKVAMRALGMHQVAVISA